jgi:hypothetical protein
MTAPIGMPMYGMRRPADMRHAASSPTQAPKAFYLGASERRGDQEDRRNRRKSEIQQYRRQKIKIRDAIGETSRIVKPIRVVGPLLA